MQIVVLDGYTENPGDLSWKGLERFGEVVVYERTAADQVAGRIAAAQIVYTNKTPLTRACLEAAPRLRYIGVLATGYDVVDIAAAARRGITVTNIPAYGTQSVAQFVFALLLEVCHRVGHHERAVRAGRWTRCRDFCFWDHPLIELAGKTMGIIGYGRIGRATARIARGFGMRVIAYDPHAEAGETVSLDEVFAAADVISLHCPLSEESARMINRDTLSRMRDGVVLINTARGALIEEEALRDALLSGKVYAAALDVVSTEPIAASNPLLGLENCLITPHIAWATKEARSRLMDVAVENLRAFLEGRAQNVVAQ